ARAADRERLPVPALRQVLDQLLSGHRTRPHDRQHQSRRRPVARRPQSTAATLAQEMSEALLEVDGLRTHFFTKGGVVKAVDDVSFTVARGEVLGLVGESGSGKSMTGYSILGLVDPPGRVVSGNLRLGGRDLRALSEEDLRQLRGNRVAMIFQDPMMT